MECRREFQVHFDQIFYLYLGLHQLSMIIPQFLPILVGLKIYALSMNHLCGAKADDKWEADYNGISFNESW